MFTWQKANRLKVLLPLRYLLHVHPPLWILTATSWFRLSPLRASEQEASPQPVHPTTIQMNCPVWPPSTWLPHPNPSMPHITPVKFCSPAFRASIQFDLKGPFPPFYLSFLSTLQANEIAPCRQLKCHPPLDFDHSLPAKSDACPSKDTRHTLIIKSVSWDQWSFTLTFTALSLWS